MTSQTLLSLYKKICLIRLAEEKIAEMYQEREMRCPVHLCIGQEAIAAGVCEDLKREDLIYSAHRCHGHYLAKGGDLKKMIAEIYGKATGCCGGKGGSMHLIDLAAGFAGATPIVGNSLPVAVGAAFASKLKGEKNITVVFIGDGTAEEGVFHESLNFAVLKKLPVLFVCENNLFSVYTHLSERQPERPIHKIAESHGMPASQHDGNNVLEVYTAATPAIEKIRNGGGPAFLEFSTYRHREHCGPFFDDHLGYRDEKEVKAWKEKDPVPYFEAYLITNKIAFKKDLEKIKKEIGGEIDQAFIFAKKSPFPSQKNLYENIFSK